MDAASSLHPTDQTLSSYGLGKLDDRSAEAVNEHLTLCNDCRKRVAEMSADSFLQRVRDAQKPSGKSASGQPQASGTPSEQRANTLTSSSADSVPPELATHPDYDIKRELGRGGMGVVYLAHNKLMGRDEVLKVMGQHLMEHSGVLERFLREIRSVAKLRHANIVTAYHATRFGQSVIFAMEHVEGLDLSKLVKTKGPMPVAHACLFIHQAALGLQHAHEEGLVHRDIKPHNLMLSRKGDKATVKILDFGLAKAAREEKVEGGLTATGQALGTPDYIAPEQILDAQTADIRADIYSLGGTLYYLLTGRPPFHAKSLYDLYQAHISRIADPLNLVRPDVPAELAALVAKMMAKDPAERFQTPGEVAQALKPFSTKPNAALAIPKTEDSQVGRRNAGRTVAEAASAATQLETDAERGIRRPLKTVESSAGESRWESMIDLKGQETSTDNVADVAPQRSSRVWPLVAVGALMLGILAAWMGGAFKVKTTDGVIVLENVPKDSEILVDGNKVTFTWPGGGKPVEIRAVPGQHMVEVKKNGFKTFGTEVTFKTDTSVEVTVRLQALEDTSGFVPLFNGKDLSGWTVDAGKGGNWTVHDGVIQGRAGGSGSALATARSDYEDFHLRLELYQESSGTQFYFRDTSESGEINHYAFSTGAVLMDGKINPLGLFGIFGISRGGINTSGGFGQFHMQEGLSEIKSPEQIPLVNKRWHIIEIIAVGNVFKMHVDGREVAAFSDTRSRLKKGKITIFTWKRTNVDIRKIEIKELTVTPQTLNAEADSENATRVGPTVITDVLFGMITKVDVVGKTLTLETKDGKIFHVSTTNTTEFLANASDSKIDIEKLSNGVTKDRAAGKKGVFVKVTHAERVASKVFAVALPE